MLNVAVIINIIQLSLVCLFVKDEISITVTPAECYVLITFTIRGDIIRPDAFFVPGFSLIV